MAIEISLATVSLYLLEGIIGLPVFSGSPERGVGLVYFTGPTMGYLIGFLSACFLSSLIKMNDNYFKIFLQISISCFNNLYFGCLVAGNIMGWDKPIIEMGVMPFLLAEILKVFLLTLLQKKFLK